MKKSEANGGVLTTGDLDKIGELLDTRMAPLATKEFVKDEINELESSLKSYIHEGVETVMGGIDRLSDQLAEKEKVERIAQAVKEIGEKVGVKVDL